MIMEFKRILFPTDFSEVTNDVIPIVVEMTKHYNARLYVLHVMHDIAQATGWYVPHMSVDELYKDMGEAAKKELERCCLEELRSYKDIERVVLRGEPTEEILKFAREHDVDLIIMGTHSRRGLERIIFGSTAEKVLMNSKCPVLTVGPEASK
jgi:nucleotide-binding universal stress UspA family protein